MVERVETSIFLVKDGDFLQIKHRSGALEVVKYNSGTDFLTHTTDCPI